MPNKCVDFQVFFNLKKKKKNIKTEIASIEWYTLINKKLIHPYAVRTHKYKHALSFKMCNKNNVLNVNIFRVERLFMYNHEYWFLCEYRKKNRLTPLDKHNIETFGIRVRVTVRVETTTTKTSHVETTSNKTPHFHLKFPCSCGSVAGSARAWVTVNIPPEEVLLYIFFSTNERTNECAVRVCVWIFVFI